MVRTVSLATFLVALTAFLLVTCNAAPAAAVLEAPSAGIDIALALVIIAIIVIIIAFVFAYLRGGKPE
ncbi:MAG: hypothetical protein OEW84_02150 [Aigarchaeota archaeon]|nr:hypothetical protein [Aigarchaeota archaeon]